MTTIVTRAGKGSPLTNVEVDANFTNLNNDKLEKTGGTITANSTDPALKITQTGSGDALRVEDASGDTTPFVIDQTGKVVIGHIQPELFSMSGSTIPQLQSHGSNGALASAGLGYWSNADATGPSVAFAKSRGVSIGLHGVVVSGDTLGNLRFSGSDSVAFKDAATISAAVDAAPAAGSMPGRLVFSTTPAGSATPVERMRIDSSGRIGIGTLPTTEAALRIGTPLTGAAIQAGVRYSGTVNSDITTEARSFASVPSTQAASFTLPTLAHFLSAQGTIGAGSTITNQLGFKAEANLVSATNNYGFYGAITAGTGRWNFYAAGTAANYFAGETTVNSGLTIGRTAITAPTASDGNVFSGTYTPANAVANTNVAVVTYHSGTHYMRVGSVVTVGIRIAVTPTAAAGTPTKVNITLPIASDFASVQDCCGALNSAIAGTINDPVAIYADTTNNCAVLQFIATSTTARYYYGTFTYRVI